MTYSREHANWINGNPDSKPSSFTAGRAEENLAYLLTSLDSTWMDRALSRSGYQDHPILREWAQSDLGSFLSINTLAEDLRSLEGSPGLHEVLLDLKSARRAQATRHVLHSAAFFARGGWAVERFFPQTSDKLPDYQLCKAGKHVAVEAKLLEMTDVEKAFNQYADALMSRLSRTVLTLDRVHPITYIIIKNPHALPEAEHVSQAVKEGLHRFSGLPLECRSSRFNVFLQPPEPGFEVYRSCQILCPRSDQENLRVQSRSKDASKQLRSEFTGSLPGIVHLELNRHQDPHVIRDLLTTRFNRGQLSGIAGVMLSMTTMHPGRPLATPIDALASLRNPRTTRPVPVELAGASVGIRAVLFDVLPPSTSLPAYAHLSAISKPKQPVSGPVTFSVPLITKLIPDAFT